MWLQQLQSCRIDGRNVRRFELSNNAGVTVELMEYGATLLRFCVPDTDADVIQLNLGMADLAAYQHNPAHFGSICGRSANRIAGAGFSLDGREYRLDQNVGNDHLHGGSGGFSHRLWRGEPLIDADTVGVRFCYTSADGENGYPGVLDCQVDYQLNAASELSISYEARVRGGPTVVNLTHHSYWNLAGTGTIENHELMLAAQQIVEVNEQLIPTGALLSVADTVFDFTSPRRIGEGIPQVLPTGDPMTAGYDHCFVNPERRRDENALSLVATLSDPRSGRSLKVSTDQPGLQCYVGSYLDGSDAVGGHCQYAGVALECQQLPDAPNQPTFPSTVLHDGEIYRQQSIYHYRPGS